MKASLDTNNSRGHELPPIRKIVTHFGKAHEDDTYASAHALYRNPQASLFRVQEVSEEDLEDPSVLVLDIGMRYEPEKRNFDHHHMAPDRADLSKNHCALTLYFMDFYKQEGYSPEETHKEMTEIFPWMDALTIKDTAGIAGLATWLGIREKSAVQGMVCQPGSTFWTQFFGKYDHFMPESKEHDMLCMLGEHIHQGILKIQERLTVLDNGAIEFRMYNRINFAVIHIPYNEEPSLAVGIWITRYYKMNKLLKRNLPNIDLTIFLSRSQNYTVYDQSGGNGRFNLLSLKELPGVEFCHPGNFIAVFKHKDLEKVIQTTAIHADKNF